MNGKNIIFKNFKLKKKNLKIKKKIQKILREKNQILLSLSKIYTDKFSTKFLHKFKKYQKLRVIGMGGSSLGTQAIYSFLKHKIKKKFFF